MAVGLLFIAALIGLTMVLGMPLARIWKALSMMGREQQQALAALDAALAARHEIARRLVHVASQHIPRNDRLVDQLIVTCGQARRSRGMIEKTKTETDLSWALGRLFVEADQKYPDLMERDEFNSLMTALETAETRIARKRMEYDRKVSQLTQRLAQPTEARIGRYAKVVAGEVFDLDPFLARMAMMNALTQGGRITLRVNRSVVA